jgi:NADPH-dependent 2,4-dienoyl-CoA reductase/sulfur reductase-like enzyme
MPDYDVVVIGAGPAGLAAAVRAAESGARVAMVDDNPHPGGQIWRAAAGKAPAEAAQWIRSAEQHQVEWIAGARVFAAPAPNRIAVEKSDGELELGYGSLILATGARERFLPFPGWTLPNVMGAGGLQALAKSGLPVEGKKIVIAGSGPLLLAVAKYMKDHGADVRLIAEQARQSALLGFTLRLAAHPGKLMQAVALRAALLGIPYLTSCWPVEAEGIDKLEAVTLRRGGKTWTERCDYLACGFGLVSNTEVAALLGCRLANGSVEVDERQHTSIKSIYSAGEATGIGGLELALVEGEIAGFAAAGASARARALFAARHGYRKFADALERAFALREELKALPREETLVCRCEDVTLGRVRACSGWREAKLHTRCGMGPCQGRVCGGALEFLLGWTPESVRPPVFPARIESLTRTAPRA